MHAFPSWFMFLMEVITSPVFWIAVAALVGYCIFRIGRWIYRKFRK